MREPRGFPDALASVRLKDSWIYATAYGLTLLCVLFLQMAPHGLPAVFGVRPLLVIPLTVYVAMFRGPLAGGVMGAVSGFLWGVFSSHLLGVDALLLLVVGCVCGLLVHMLMRNNLISATLLASVAIAAVGLADWFLFTAIWNPSESFYALWRFVLPQTVYTIVLSPLLYGVVLYITRHMKQNEDD